MMSPVPHERKLPGFKPFWSRRAISVFINCPYDAEFQETFDAILFATICSGFFPRSAIESGPGSEPRMDRISQAMTGSKYSIHDLSRCTGSGEANLARFNMPLELGMAIHQKHERRDAESEHDWLMIVPKGHSYRRFLSDLAGYDPAEYDGSVESALSLIMAWLATRPDSIITPTPVAVLRVLPEFVEARNRLRDAWHGCEPWPDLLAVALTVAKDGGLTSPEHSC